jgi:hypothetical protein
MGTADGSETSVTIYQITWRHAQEDHNPNPHISLYFIHWVQARLCYALAHSFRDTSCTCPPHTQINLFYWFDLIELIWILVICFILLFSVRVFRTMWEIWIYEEYYITLSLDISNVMLRASRNFCRALLALCLTLVDQPGSSGLWACFAGGLQPASGTHVSEFGGPQPYDAGSTNKLDWSI